MEIRLLRHAFNNDRLDAATLIAGQLAVWLSSALDELRELARGVHPAVLAAGGLCPPLKPVARRSSVPVRLDVRVVERLAEPIEIAAYVVSEALTNAAKHARATVVDIEVDANDDVVRIRVRDDGRGGARLDSGTGLLGLRDRVETAAGCVFSPLSARVRPWRPSFLSACIALPDGTDAARTTNPARRATSTWART